MISLADRQLTEAVKKLSPRPSLQQQSPPFVPFLSLDAPLPPPSSPASDGKRTVKQEDGDTTMSDAEPPALEHASAAPGLDRQSSLFHDENAQHVPDAAPLSSSSSSSASSAPSVVPAASSAVTAVATDKSAEVVATFPVTLRHYASTKLNKNNQTTAEQQRAIVASRPILRWQDKHDAKLGWYQLEDLMYICKLGSRAVAASVAALPTETRALVQMRSSERVRLVRSDALPTLCASWSSKKGALCASGRAWILAHLV